MEWFPSCLCPQCKLPPREKRRLSLLVPQSKTLRALSCGYNQCQLCKRCHGRWVPLCTQTLEIAWWSPWYQDFLLQGSSEGGGGLNFIRQVFFTGGMRVFLGSEAFREKEYFLLPNRILIKSLSSITNGSSFLTGFELECWKQIFEMKLLEI